MWLPDYIVCRHFGNHLSHEFGSIAAFQDRESVGEYNQSLMEFLWGSEDQNSKRNVDSGDLTS